MSGKITKLSITQMPLFLGVLVAIFIFSLFIFNLKDASASFTVSRPSSLNAGLVGYWTFDGADTNFTTNTVADKSGNGNNGTMLNMSTSTARAPGKIGQALRFDGASSYIESTSFPTLTNNSFTISAWVYANSVGGSPSIVSDGSGSQSTGYALNFQNSKLNFYSYNGANRQLNSTTTLVPKKWYHVVAVWTKDLKKELYLNGVSEISTDTNVNITEDDTGLRIGKYSNSFPLIFPGLIDEVRIYNRVLSASEVKQLYNQGSSKFNKSPVNTLTSGLVGYWTFDGADTNFTTNTVADKSGNGNNGTMLNMSTSTARAPGKIGQALNFDGVNDYVRIPYNSSLKLGNNGTLSLWVKPKIISPAKTRIMLGYGIESGDPGNTDGYLISQYDTRLLVYWMSSVVVTVTNVFSPDKWTNIILTNNNGSLIAYIDGVLNGTGTSGGAIINNYSTIIGGGRNDWYENGLIDEVRIYNRALSASEVKSLYNQSASKFNVSPVKTLTTGLVGHWTFDGADTNFTTNTVADKSGNGNNGTMTNMSTSTARAPGKIGQALKFDGVDDRVDITQNSGLNITGAVTLSGWVKIVSTPSSGGSFFGKGNNQGAANNRGPYKIGYVASSNSLWWTLGDGTTSSIQGYSFTPAMRKWYFFVGTWDGTTNSGGQKLYVDGVEVVSQASSVSTLRTDLSFKIGVNDFNSSGQYHNGLIDEVRVYNRALSASEVKALYKMGH